MVFSLMSLSISVRRMRTRRAESLTQEIFLRSSQARMVDSLTPNSWAASATVSIPFTAC
jgi:hypothetical protein